MSQDRSTGGWERHCLLLYLFHRKQQRKEAIGMRTKSNGTYIKAFFGVVLALAVVSVVLRIVFFLAFRVVLPIAFLLFLVYVVKQYLDRNRYNKSYRHR